MWIETSKHAFDRHFKEVRIAYILYIASSDCVKGISEQLKLFK